MTKKLVNIEAGSVAFTFDDGGTQAFDLSQVSAEIVRRLALHGASQKIGDSYAGAADESDPLAYAKEAVKDTIAQLYAGDWRVTVSGGPRISDLATAMSRISGKTVEECVTLLSDKSDEQKKELRKKPQVAAMLAAISAEKASAKAKKLAAAAAGGESITF